MTQNLQRALLLFEQSRFDLAESELRQALATEPQEAHAHAMLALCLARREEFQEATAEAQQAIHLAPDMAFAHYALADILRDRNRPEEALAAVEEALRLEPEDADYCALLAQIRLDLRQWPAALEAAERGLQSNPEHVGCTNLRALALVKLGRKKEAGATIDAALAKDPDNSVTHANQGWTYLEQSDPARALHHFREALRLDPTNEWARQGIIEALKARHFIYAVVLRYFLWMAKLSPRAQWAIILGGYFGNRILGSLAQSQPDLAPWVWPVRILYLTFALLTWAAYPLFNLLLRLNKFGRLALSREQIVASNWVGLCVLLAVLSLTGWMVAGFNGPFLLGALVFGLLIIPTSGTFKCDPGWPRRVMAGYTATMALAGVTAVVLELVTDGQPRAAVQTADALGWICFMIFLLGAIGSGWVANLLIMQRPKR